MVMCGWYERDALDRKTRMCGDDLVNYDLPMSRTPSVNFTEVTADLLSFCNFDRTFTSNSTFRHEKQAVWRINNAYNR